MKVKEQSEKVGLKLNIQKTKTVASNSITSWQIDGETVETVFFPDFILVFSPDFIFLGSEITACPCVESSLVLLEEGVCYDQCILLAKLCKPLPSFILYSKAKFASYSRYLLISYFCISVLYYENDIFGGVNYRRSCMSS